MLSFECSIFDQTAERNYNLLKLFEVHLSINKIINE